MVVNSFKKKYFILNKVILVVFFVSVFMTELSAQHILGGEQSFDQGPTSSINLVLRDYWRSNLVLNDGFFTGKKKAMASHVPGLIEYKVDFKTGGEYELLAKYASSESSKTFLSVEGEKINEVFTEEGEYTKEWVSLGIFKVTSGSKHIRLTSEYVETLFPELSGLRLVYKSSQLPAPVPEPTKRDLTIPLPEDWYRGISRKIHCDFHTGGFVKGIGKNFDPEVYAKTLKENGLNSITLFAKGHHGYAYYNTKVGTRHPGLDFDLMKAQIEACHKHGITAWVYFSINIDEMYGTTVEGEGEVDNKYQSVDSFPTTQYVKDYTWPMIIECVRDYEIDGFWFDFPGNDEFVSETIDLIRSYRSDIIIANNHQFYKPHEELAKQDVLEIEAWMHRQSLYRLPYIARYAHGSIPMTAMTTRFWTGWGDFGGFADESLLHYETAVCLANGCGITIGDQLHPYGAFNQEAYKSMSKAMHLAERVEPYVFGAKLVPYVAYLRPNTSMNSVQANEAMESNERASSVLVDAGIHFTVIDMNNSLDPYKVVIVQNPADLPETYIHKLEAYVKTGGKLMVEGLPGERLQKLAGIKLDKDVKSQPAFIRIDPTVMPDPIPTDIYSRENVQFVKSLDESKTFASIVLPMNFGTDHKISHRQSPPMEDVSDYPAITMRSLGEGTIVFFAFPVFTDYAVSGNSQNRKIFKSTFNRIVEPGDRLVEVKAPVNIEVSVFEQPNRTMVHLIHGGQGRRASNFEDPIMDETSIVKGAIVTMPEDLVKGKTIRFAEKDGVISGVQYKNGLAEILIPEFSIYTALVIE
jgi:Hypothetical glycosyl hydrolase 6